MNVLSLNVCGIQTKKKRDWVRNICSDYGIIVLGIQETKMTQLHLFFVKSMWVILV